MVNVGNITIPVYAEHDGRRYDVGTIHLDVEGQPLQGDKPVIAEEIRIDSDNVYINGKPSPFAIADTDIRVEYSPQGMPAIVYLPVYADTVRN